MSKLFFDTETTGFFDKRMPLNWEGQPHICQLGAILTNDEGLIKAEINLLVKPDGWIIPEKVSAIHGITQEDALKYGMSIKGVLSIFAQLLLKCDTLIAHNIIFDLDMLSIANERTGIILQLPETHFCTMQQAKDIMKLPPTEKMKSYNMKAFKNPNLQEAHEFFLGRKFEGAHDAMADVRACKDVYFKLTTTQQTKEGE